MRKITTTAILLASLALAPAAQAADSYAFGNRVLTVGDSVGRLVELAGTPVHKDVVENEYGARESETWEYRRDEKTLLVTVKDGKVQQIQEIY